MADNFLTGVVSVVEATRCEQYFLWKENRDTYKRTWVQNLSGYISTIGYVDERPIVLSLTTAVIDGHKLLFVDPCSQLVDWKMVDEWLDKNLTCKREGSEYLNKTDAVNFHNVFR